MDSCREKIHIKYTNKREREITTHERDILRIIICFPLDLMEILFKPENDNIRFSKIISDLSKKHKSLRRFLYNYITERFM